MSTARADQAGLFFAVGSSAMFGTSGTLGSALIRTGWSPAAAVTVRITLAAVLLTVPAVIGLRGRWRALRSGAPLIAWYGLLAVAGAQLCYFNALSHLSVGVALLLEYSGTVLVVGWMWLRHGQRPRRLTVAGASLALLGLALVLNLTGSQRLDPVGLLWGLGAACGLAVYFIVSASTNEDLPPLAIAWGGMTVAGISLIALGSAGVLPMRASGADVTLFHRHVSWLVPVLGLAVVAGAAAYVLGIAGARLLGARLASFISLMEVVFAIAFAWLTIGQVPLPIQLLGGAVLIAGVTLVRIDELRDEQKYAEPTMDQPDFGDATSSAVAGGALERDTAAQRG